MDRLHPRRDKFHFVLVHGSGHGAWCWYKVIARLEGAGHTVTALDLASSGIHKSDAGSIGSVAEYVSPLMNFLAHSVLDHQVVLVGHSLGGCAISYAMEAYPEKISKAIFISAFMPRSGDYFVDPQLLQELVSNGLVRLLHIANHSEANSCEPIAMYFDSKNALQYLYNKSSEEDKCLALACLNAAPIVLAKECINLTPERYGSLPRFYIRCEEDACNFVFDNKALAYNPPHKVFSLPNSDHSCFFSVPDALVKLLLDICM
ncbi:hypothetical protein KP509_07G014200 [Ceratopteris richardii]|nr:hypothetical protein KP509_07G014200 [Ceratopteris richardii]KAH7432235.1 hypothetical protein KP509_07G014200 [Ceratopteris richardii]KAH7432237.1 hypothetical protein KP509_07G014200 [Ceratopteris richardii]